MQLVDMQLKHNDCGVSVIKTLCNIYGVKLPRSHIEQNLPLAAQGSRLSDIKAFLESHGFKAAPQLLDFNINDESYYASRTPFILPTEDEGRLHYVVINGYRNGRFEVLDPRESAPYKLTLAELRKLAHVSDNPMRGFSARDQAVAVCTRLLREYGLDADEVLKKLHPDHLFNKITYFVHIRDGFGFKNAAAERDFLHELLFNLDMGQVPAQFALLKIEDGAVSVKAPVILPVEKHRAAAINANTKEDAGERNAFLVLYDALGGHKKNVLLFILIALASVSFSQLYVFINQYFLDEILDLKNTSVIVLFALGVLGYRLFDLALRLWKKWLALVVSIRLDRLFLSSFDEKMNLYSLAFIQSFKKGDLTERLSDATKLKAFFTKYLVNILVDTAVSAYILAVLLYLNWKLTLITLAVMVLFYAWFKWITPFLQRNEQIRFARKSDFFSAMLEKMEGIQTLKCLRYEGVFSGKISANIENLLDIQARTQKLNVLNSGVTSLITMAATVLLIFFLSYESAGRGAMSLGEVVTFLTLSSRIFSSLGGLLDENLTVQENAIILKRYLNFQEPRDDDAPYTPFPGRLESVALKGVSFGYHPADPVLKDLSFTVNRGDKIRIEGKNGSGKSTLSKVIALLYPVQGGSILINGAPMSDFCAEAVKEKILLTSNEDALFNDTLLYNLTFQNAVWDERIDLFAEHLGLTAWINGLRKQGAEYRISESGKNLSTGQRKKLLILRALLHPAEFVIFDEVLSGIDAESRAHIERYLDTVKDKTFIFISHESIKHIRFTKTYAISGKCLAECS